MLREFEREYFIIISKIRSQASSAILLSLIIYFVMYYGNKIKRN